MGTHPRVLRKSYPLNTNITVCVDGLQNLLHPNALDVSGLLIGRVNISPSKKISIMLLLAQFNQFF